MSDFLFDILENISNEIQGTNKKVPSQRVRQQRPKPQRTVQGAQKTKKRSVDTEREPDNSGVVDKNKTTPKSEDAYNVSSNQRNDILPDFSNLTEKEVVSGIVFSEILGRPKSIRKRHR
ncbi:hypothetical protein RBH29_10275 [Herbivorax sp. ANBcel31]|uniref:hypothetical protein n=1 Tax=Herbivorax sp. ANBcel31 TaxID=3069754 RepID=UPI0027B148F9|nr:hypothetical protein [Herbivorax sp. ANBcel31]MDQ2086810.1 hypothetical protein [Herbivorax sp. ANBcel31]